ncbi:MAG: DUF4215 domain-containing protein, partial [Candidatus Peribacteraceae bacterium]|nr:DUF4215 domain-containing protein [Candidatus Peribacteraceae bacterium]
MAPLKFHHAALLLVGILMTAVTVTTRRAEMPLTSLRGSAPYYGSSSSFISSAQTSSSPYCALAYAGTFSCAGYCPHMCGNNILEDQENCESDLQVNAGTTMPGLAKFYCKNCLASATQTYRGDVPFIVDGQWGNSLTVGVGYVVSVNRWDNSSTDVADTGAMRCAYQLGYGPASFQIPFIVPQSYDLYVNYLASVTLSSSVTYTAYNTTGGGINVTINQRIPPSDAYFAGVAWKKIGTWDPGNQLSLAVNVQSAQLAVLDALMVAPAGYSFPSVPASSSSSSSSSSAISSSSSVSSSAPVPHITAAPDRGLFLHPTKGIFVWRSNGGQSVSNYWNFNYINQVSPRVVAAGMNHNLAIGSDGGVYAWGSNYGCVLGNNICSASEQYYETPYVRVVGIGGGGYFSEAKAVSVGKDFSLALNNGGNVYAWGVNFAYQLGNGTTNISGQPVQVKGVGGQGNLTNIAAISAGDHYSLALGNDGFVYAWGYNGYGQYGDGTIADSTTPVRVKGVGGQGYLANIVAISAGYGHSLAIDSSGNVYAWGLNEKGQLGTGTTTNSTTPVRVKGVGGGGNLTGIAAISAGYDHSLALDTNGGVFAWGKNESGELGNGTTTNSATPVRVKGESGQGYLTGMREIVASKGFSLALNNSGFAYGWGENSGGQLLDGTGTNRSLPAPLSIWGDGYRVSPEECDEGMPTEDSEACYLNYFPKGQPRLMDTLFLRDGWTCDNSRPNICQKCPNGKKEGTEGCDDGNSTNGDGCSVSCAVEPGYICTGTTSVCRICGDGKKEGLEACDDNNTAANDGCSSACTVETGWTCNGASPSVCTPVCGNGIRSGSEQCDDDNTAANDGCSATCVLETGYTCSTAQPNVCQKCGNGKREGTEACDDNNATFGDGCSQTCALETGYTCSTAQPNVCQKCGNAKKEGTEICDDGNVASGDGCSASCSTEEGWTCDMNRVPICKPICGDGFTLGPEQCDDRNG